MVVKCELVIDETEKTRKGYATIRRRILISPMFKKVWDMINFEKSKKASSKTVQEALKRIFPDRHVHELRYTFISRCKDSRIKLFGWVIECRVVT